MEICFRINGVMHCIFVPILEWPVIWHKPGPGPVNYPAFFQDATILASVQGVVSSLGNAEVGRALGEGVRAAMKVMQEHVETYATIREVNVGEAR